ncbi:hypothetical protein QL285_076756 [Trifolium repens]|nr:hypothetical protein QL285_076756 [Trifolium repens]
MWRVVGMVFGKLNLLTKARHLLWRLCRACLPTQCRLTQRYVDCELSCPVRDIEVEDDVHVFFGFASASESWSAVGLSQLLHNATYLHGIVANRVIENVQKCGQCDGRASGITILVHLV